MTTEEAKILLANLKRYMSGGGVIDRNANKAIDMAIEALKHHEPHWIPVTEGLPEVGENALLSYFDEITIGWLNSDGLWSIYDGWKCVNADEVSAWMPLPEPWKGE